MIRAIVDMDAYYVIAGKGNLQDHLRALIDDLGLTNRVKLLGYRKDIPELCKAADVFLFPSFREGLSVSVMEAMACGLPVICSKIRGNTDLIDENGGELFDPSSAIDCKNAISKLLKRDLTRIGEYNRSKIKNFDIENVNKIMTELYATFD